MQKLNLESGYEYCIDLQQIQLKTQNIFSFYNIQ